MTAQQRFYELKDLSECKWREAQDLVSREEDRQSHIRCNNHGAISKEDEAQWMTVLATAYALQKEAIELEKEAAVARVEMIREQYRTEYPCDNDYAELLQEQTELRGQL